ncbi:hypothetical protein VOLCADRAFT_88286 [Volvox carteri f. nagariensis]|uniref:Uncharacterized protein n=1 Tax=Volvox carteri f. nagariensis TaxID=3068 RepID=D8TNT0_VOLCA|nr:uncharacterized protein VOLCADRAFT_88286 [Volvox carteri f. nagariensis]EFJ51047.1 hypothetical protein VOLCADRAFT_88286 [Volvox carteri f. nagariensis]|eukprot:XP_002948059.1 hypothetical protein VOLCADRAFT_88286 [Volvox carteri f. nagariensis]
MAKHSASSLRGTPAKGDLYTALEAELADIEQSHHAVSPPDRGPSQLSSSSLGASSLGHRAKHQPVERESSPGRSGDSSPTPPFFANVCVRTLPPSKEADRLQRLAAQLAASLDSAPQQTMPVPTARLDVGAACSTGPAHSVPSGLPATAADSGGEYAARIAALAAIRPATAERHDKASIPHASGNAVALGPAAARSLVDFGHTVGEKPSVGNALQPLAGRPATGAQLPPGGSSGGSFLGALEAVIRDEAAMIREEAARSRAAAAIAGGPEAGKAAASAANQPISSATSTVGALGHAVAGTNAWAGAAPTDTMAAAALSPVAGGASTALDAADPVQRVSAARSLAALFESYWRGGGGDPPITSPRMQESQGPGRERELQPPQERDQEAGGRLASSMQRIFPSNGSPRLGSTWPLPQHGPSAAAREARPARLPLSQSQIHLQPQLQMPQQRHESSEPVHQLPQGLGREHVTPHSQYLDSDAQGGDMFASIDAGKLVLGGGSLGRIRRGASTGVGVGSSVGSASCSAGGGSTSTSGSASVAGGPCTRGLSLLDLLTAELAGDGPHAATGGMSPPAGVRTASSGGGSYAGVTEPHGTAGDESAAARVTSAASQRAELATQHGKQPALVQATAGPGIQPEVRQSVEGLIADVEGLITDLGAVAKASFEHPRTDREGHEERDAPKQRQHQQHEEPQLQQARLRQLQQPISQLPSPAPLPRSPHQPQPVSEPQPPTSQGQEHQPQCPPAALQPLQLQGSQPRPPPTQSTPPHPHLHLGTLAEQIHAAQQQLCTGSARINPGPDSLGVADGRHHCGVTPLTVTSLVREWLEASGCQSTTTQIANTVQGPASHSKHHSFSPSRLGRPPTRSSAVKEQRVASKRAEAAAMALLEEIEKRIEVQRQWTTEEHGEDEYAWMAEKKADDQEEEEEGKQDEEEEEEEGQKAGVQGDAPLFGPPPSFDDDWLLQQLNSRANKALGPTDTRPPSEEPLQSARQAALQALQRKLSEVTARYNARRQRRHAGRAGGASCTGRPGSGRHGSKTLPDCGPQQQDGYHDHQHHRYDRAAGHQTFQLQPTSCPGTGQQQCTSLQHILAQLATPMHCTAAAAPGVNKAATTVTGAAAVAPRTAPGAVPAAARAAAAAPPITKAPNHLAGAALTSGGPTGSQAANAPSPHVQSGPSSLPDPSSLIPIPGPAASLNISAANQLPAHTTLGDGAASSALDVWRVLRAAPSPASFLPPAAAPAAALTPPVSTLHAAGPPGVAAMGPQVWLPGSLLGHLSARYQRVLKDNIRPPWDQSLSTSKDARIPSWPAVLGMRFGVVDGLRVSHQEAMRVPASNSAALTMAPVVSAPAGASYWLPQAGSSLLPPQLGQSPSLQSHQVFNVGTRHAIVAPALAHAGEPPFMSPVAHNRTAAENVVPVPWGSGHIPGDVAAFPSTYGATTAATPQMVTPTPAPTPDARFRPLRVLTEPHASAPMPVIARGDVEEIHALSAMAQSLPHLDPLERVQLWEQLEQCLAQKLARSPRGHIHGAKRRVSSPGAGPGISPNSFRSGDLYSRANSPLRGYATVWERRHRYGSCSSGGGSSRDGSGGAWSPRERHVKWRMEEGLSVRQGGQGSNEADVGVRSMSQQHLVGHSSGIAASVRAGVRPSPEAAGSGSAPGSLLDSTLEMVHNVIAPNATLAHALSLNWQKLRSQGMTSRVAGRQGELTAEKATRAWRVQDGALATNISPVSSVDGRRERIRG